MNGSFADLALQPHATSARSPIETIAASGSIDAAGLLTLDFLLHGELRKLKLPQPLPTPAHSPVRRDELWQHTCLELFARVDGARGYLEFNFSPSGDWAAYEFDDYRSARRNIESIACTVRSSRQGNTLRVHATLSVPAMVATSQPVAWQLNLAAVMESSDGALSYWALRHPRAQPDFHDPAGFSCTLTVPAH
jgi:hypothetical protein